MEAKMTKTLIILAHPNIEESKCNRLLLDSVQNLSDVTIHDLYKIYPDFKINQESEQKLLREHQNIVFQFPLYWYSSPAILKEWLDKVFSYGFAFGTADSALKGKNLLVAVTTGGPKEAYMAGGYNNFTLSELLRPYQQTANLCSMKYLTPFAMSGVMKSSEREKALAAEEYRTLLQSLK
jgi:glutathione-regulated potassium-efflux system ancillary protein KefG